MYQPPKVPNELGRERAWRFLNNQYANAQRQRKVAIAYARHLGINEGDLIFDDSPAEGEYEGATEVVVYCDTLPEYKGKTVPILYYIHSPMGRGIMGDIEWW